MTIDVDQTTTPPAADTNPWRLAAGIQVLPYSSNEAFLRCGSRSSMSQVIRDPERRNILISLLENLDGSESTVNELSHRTGTEEEEVASLLEQLAKAGVVEAIEPTAEQIQTLAIVTDGLLGQTIIELLSDQFEITEFALDEDPGVTLQAAIDQEPDLFVLALDRYRPSVESEADELVADHRIPLMRVTTDGDQCLVGPIIVPGHSACLNCLDIQDESSRQFKHDFLAYKDHLNRAESDPTSKGSSNTIAISLTASMAASAIVAAKEKKWGFLFEQVVRFDLARFDVVSDRIMALPRCPLCIRTRPAPRHTFL